MFLKLDCWFITIWNTVQNFFKSKGDVTPVMGHLYTKHEIHRNCIVQIDYCDHCGHMTMTWYREGSIPDEDLIKMCGTLDSDKEANT